MITEVTFLPVAGVDYLKRQPSTVVISILSYAERDLRPKSLSNFFDALSLEFLDTYEECSIWPDFIWPDDPTPPEHAFLSECRDEQVPSLEHARRIVETVHRWHALPQRLRLVTHCYKGRSRSASVADWAAKALSAKLTPYGNVRPLEDGNPRLRRLLEKAAAECAAPCTP